MEPDSSEFNLYNENLTNCDLNFDEYNDKTPGKNSNNQPIDLQLDFKNVETLDVSQKQGKIL